MWAVTARWSLDVGAWTRSGSIPTFYLHEDVQGIVSPDHAERVARAILAPDGVPSGVTWYVTVARVTDATVLS